MDRNKPKIRNKYDRVMPRVYNRSNSSLESRPLVTRHERTPAKIGAKQSFSNVSSSVFSDLPVVLNDYAVEEPKNKVNKHSIVKPRRTIKSMDPSTSPYKSQSVNKPNRSFRGHSSTPALFTQNLDIWSKSRYRQCNSSRSHNELKELKDEIKMFRENEKLMTLRAKLYKSCGVVLDDVGDVCSDKAVQVETADNDDARDLRSCQERQDARAPLPDQQMRLAVPTYPVDRYLVEKSKTFEMVNIIDDDLWKVDPALRPEDEIMLRRLHEMLHSTAEDLKELSGELSRYREPGVQVKTQPMPLDNEFNEKVHIEEIVNAKFHGYKIIDNPNLVKDLNMKPSLDVTYTKTDKYKHNIRSNSQVDRVEVIRKPNVKKLSKTPTKVYFINDKCNDEVKQTKTSKNTEIKHAPTVSYNEIIHKCEPKINLSPKVLLSVQQMPSINIRSELTEQKVLKLDIKPDDITKIETTENSNVATIELQHKDVKPEVICKTSDFTHKNYHPKHLSAPVNTIRKVSKMSTCDSSESNNNSDLATNSNKHIKFVPKISPKSSSARSINLKKCSNKKDRDDKRNSRSVDSWKRKLNSVYGQTTNLAKNKVNPKTKIKKCDTKIDKSDSTKTQLKSSEYIPYSQLTLGGVSIGEIEREISDDPIRTDKPLTPILDKILNSRENSFHKESPNKNKDDLKILNTSDEALLQEVIDIENKIKKTLSKNVINNMEEIKAIGQKESKDAAERSSVSEQNLNEEESYDDDFEESDNDESEPINNDNAKDSAKNGDKNESSSPKKGDTTYVKKANLSFKHSVDVFEYVHSVDTQDNATQSPLSQTISLKETQTSPQSEKSNIQPIHNDLWPSIDPKNEVERLFKLEKEFIKKLIIEEYGDVLEKTLTKPSTSNGANKLQRNKNIAASQKNTQTSPAHVKSVMTSPRHTKTRTTSPFMLNLTVDRQTSPYVCVTSEEQEIGAATEVTDAEELGITINLSSPRFSLRLPQTSRDVLSNIEQYSRRQISKEDHKSIPSVNIQKQSSTSLEADVSSEMSSLGEVTYIVKRRLRANRISSQSETSITSSSSSDINLGSILPLRSEGEIVQTQALRRRSSAKTDDDKSLGQL